MYFIFKFLEGEVVFCVGDIVSLFLELLILEFWIFFGEEVLEFFCFGFLGFCLFGFGKVFCWFMFIMFFVLFIILLMDGSEIDFL